MWEIGLRMNIAPYPFVRVVGNRYEFTSVGRREIQKVIDFTLLDDSDLYNLCLGDLMPDGRIDDLVNTNNGDLVRIFATVIAATVDFLERTPWAVVYFTGSTENRTKLYGEILRRNYSSIKDKYTVFATFWRQNKLVKAEFDPDLKKKYQEYYICMKKFKTSLL